MQSFQRATGASADANEIAFVSAIHQGEHHPRPDGTIKAADVCYFLLSRYGIQVEEDEVRKTIIKGFGGADAEDECIDMSELTATLLIPYLFKATRGLITNPNGVPSSQTDSGVDCVIGDVLKMILGDVTGSTAPVVINRSLVRRILSTYGENELSRDRALVDEMILAATGGREGVRLNEKAFARAVAGDVQKYPVDSETSTSSNYCDVFPDEDDHPLSETMGTDQKFADEEQARGITRKPSEATVRPVEVRTANGIDFISDTHQSKLFVVCLWAFFVLTQWTYLPNAMWGTGTENCKERDFGCIIGNRIVTWLLIAVFYSVGGTLFITAGSWGNSFQAESVWPAVVSILLMTVATIVPISVRATDKVDQDYSEEFLSSVTIAFGVLVILLQLVYLLGRHPRFQANITNSRGVQRVFAQLQTGNVLTESFVKEAAAKKTHLIVRNALEVHTPTEEIDFGIDKSYNQAMLNFGKRGEEIETCGGLRWTWHCIRTWKLSKIEGVLIPSKLLTANLMQLIMSVFVTILLILSTSVAAQSVDEYVKEQDPQGVLISDALRSNLVKAILTSGYLGAGVCFVVCLVLTLAYIPSIVRTTLQFRCGTIASLGDAAFNRYTEAPDSVSKTPGSCMWAIFHAGVAVFFVFGVVTFFFAFEGTRNTAYSITAQIIGFLIPTIFKLILLVVLRNRFYAGQYRKKPVSANFLGLALQCLDYGLAFGYMLFRAVKLILVPVYYIGRVDTPVFATSVGRVGILVLDDAPIHFRKLIIQSEAHRHPYIETLGKMYLLKLRHREQFGKTAGSRWRMIFVSALMPWMRRHRVIINADADADESTTDMQGSFAAEIERSFRVGSRNEPGGGAVPRPINRIGGAPDQKNKPGSHGGKPVNEETVEPNQNRFSVQYSREEGRTDARAADDTIVLPHSVVPL